MFHNFIFKELHYHTVCLISLVTRKTQSIITGKWFLKKKKLTVFSCMMNDCNTYANSFIMIRSLVYGQGYHEAIITDYTRLPFTASSLLIPESYL